MQKPERGNALVGAGQSAFFGSLCQSARCICCIRSGGIGIKNIFSVVRAIVCDPTGALTKGALPQRRGEHCNVATAGP